MEPAQSEPQPEDGHVFTPVVEEVYDDPGTIVTDGSITHVPDLLRHVIARSDDNLDGTDSQQYSEHGELDLPMASIAPSVAPSFTFDDTETQASEGTAWEPPQWSIRPTDKKIYVSIQHCVSAGWSLTRSQLSKLLAPRDKVPIMISAAKAGVEDIPTRMGGRAGKFAPAEDLLARTCSRTRSLISAWLKDVRDSPEYISQMRELGVRIRNPVASHAPSTMRMSDQQPASTRDSQASAIVGVGPTGQRQPAPLPESIVCSKPSASLESDGSKPCRQPTSRQIGLSEAFGKVNAPKAIDWELVKAAIDGQLNGLSDKLRQWAEDKFDVTPSQICQLTDILTERLEIWSANHCGHLDGDDDTMADDTEHNEKYWAQFGLVQRNSKWMCAASCSLSIPVDAKLVDLQRHVVSDAHELAALKQRDKFSLPGGLPARQLWRDNVRNRETAELSKVTKPKVTQAIRCERQKAWNAERARRINDLRKTPIIPVDSTAVPLKRSSDVDPEMAKKEVNMSFLSAWLSANLSLAAVDGMWEWLRDHLVHGPLLAKRSWLLRQYEPLLRGEQEERIVQAIKASKKDGLTVMIDGSTDLAHDQKPFNFLIATSTAVYFCATYFCNPKESETAESIIPLVREFSRKWLPADLPDYVQWFSTDNDPKMGLLFKKLSESGALFHNAQWLGCLAHGAARIGACIKNKKCVARVHSFCVLLSSLLKGKVFVQRRWALRQALTAAGREAHTLPDKWGGTRWQCWYDCVKFVAMNCGFLQKWIRELHPKTESDAWAGCLKCINEHGNDIKVESMYVMHMFKPLYDSIDTIFQLSPLPRGSASAAKCRTPNHLLYNKLDSLHSMLAKSSQVTKPEELHADVLKAMQRGKIEFVAMKPVFVEIAQAAAAIALKYRDNSTGQLAKAMRVFDPLQKHNWGLDSLEDFVRVLPRTIHPRLTSKDSGESEWEKYLSLQPPAATVNLLAWWSSLASVLPCLAAQANTMLRILITTVEVEASFSVYKQTRDEQQWAMSPEVHNTRMSFAFNGIMPKVYTRMVDDVNAMHIVKPPVHKRSRSEPPDDVVEVVTKPSIEANAQADGVQVAGTAVPLEQPDRPANAANCRPKGPKKQKVASISKKVKGAKETSQQEPPAVDADDAEQQLADYEEYVHPDVGEMPADR